MSAARAASPELRIVPWPDDVIDHVGFSPADPYPELVWLPMIGPSSYLLWRHCVIRLRHQSSGFLVGWDELAAALGVGRGRGPRSLLAKTLRRLERFGVARPAPGGYAIRRRLPRLTERQAARLPARARHAHRAFIAAPVRAG